MIPITLTVNGRRVEATVEPRTHLADFLREQQRLTGTHLGCEQGVCGACTILLDGVPARACLAFAVACDGAEIRTVEGFDGDPLMARLREAFSAEHALQCGFCTPGMLISAYDLIRRLPEADEARIRRELSGNLCRCTGYVGIVAAVQRVLAEVPKAATAPSPAAEASPSARADTPLWGKIKTALGAKPKA
ncbi:MAG TPA: (2Fe-2S)-binding protein [Stellaceae bacterium]|nr:(2Fe-2S)-binding protein [Stellaceae bacterium]